MSKKFAGSPQEFLKMIPRGLKANLKFRERLTEELKDKEYRKVFLQMCRIEPRIAFHSILWTFNPRQTPRKRELPFILWPSQGRAADKIHSSITNGHDLVIEKSRYEGATELVIKMYLIHWLLIPNSVFLIGSRKEEYVDAATNIHKGRVAGNQKCLFHKLLYGLANLPKSIQPEFAKSHLQLENLTNGSTIHGESTNESFGAGGRAGSIFLDEFARVNPADAQYIKNSVADVSDSVIYGSTHWRWGRAHPFAKLRHSGGIDVCLLPWYQNPDKSAGLYTSPDINSVIIKDWDYYHKRYPSISQTKYKASALEKQIPEHFVADGSNKLRSPWYDKEEQRRDKIDMARNIDMNPVGSGDMFFDPAVCSQLRANYVREADLQGEVEFNTYKGEVKGGWFTERDHGRLKLWTELDDGALNPTHNYIVACDISMGTGASNSVAGIYDVNTREKVGQWVSPNVPPESFAEQVVAICKWAAGNTMGAYLIWETMGPGFAFGRRVAESGYDFIYRRTDETIPYRPRGKQNGWFPNRQSKTDLLMELRIALAEGVKGDTIHKSLIVHDEQTVGEYEDYVFLENGGIGPVYKPDTESGGRHTHGDRVIPDGLYVLALSEQPKAATKRIVAAPWGSYQWRRERYLDEERAKRKDSKYLV